MLNNFHSSHLSFHLCHLLIYQILVLFGISDYEWEQKLQELLKKQDEGLDILAKSVDRLGQLSMGISEELGQQNKMLDSMETDLDVASEDLDTVTAKTKELIAKAGGTGSFCLIVVLSIVVLVLLMFLIYG